MTGVGILLGMAIATPFMLPARSIVNIAATLPPSESIMPIAPGSLRVSNQTYHPIRIALLPQIPTVGPSIAQPITEPVRIDTAIEFTPSPTPTSSPTPSPPTPSPPTPSPTPSPITPSPPTPSPPTPSLHHPSPTPSPPTPQYGDPLHWDFVPREGHAHGLILAIPEGYVQIQPGDVLTAFAQDGSRRYWGPYVVGVTDSPMWDQDTQEWSLVLETPFPY